MAEERRKKFRVSVTRPVVIQLSSGKKVHAYISDFAENGMGVLTSVPAEIGAKLVFIFSLPIGNDIHDLRLVGEIMYCRIRADKYINGVAFPDLSPELHKIIKKYILSVRSKRA